MFHLQHTPNTVQALINTEQGRGAHVYCQLDERSRPIDNKYAFMNKHKANSIVTGVTFAHFFEFCVDTTVDNNNETI